MNSRVDIPTITGVRPKYQTPSMKVMNESDVLVAFQMSATKIGAAGCWWTGCNSSPVEENS
jgi:hypothetical protein